MALLRSRMSLLLSLYLVVHGCNLYNGHQMVMVKLGKMAPWKAIETRPSTRRVCMTKQLQEGENPMVNSARTAALAHDVD